MNSSILCFTAKGAQTAARILAVLQNPEIEIRKGTHPEFGTDQKPGGKAENAGDADPGFEKSKQPIDGNGKRFTQHFPNQTARAWCRKKDFFPDPPLENWEGSVHDWTREQFEHCDAVIFVGATGIAVRSIAPFLVSKVSDPAVIVVDEQGNYVISLVSGHIGGANELCREIAAGIGAAPIISTATDLNKKFAVDVFARKNDLWISSMKLAKELSAALLDGKRIAFSSEIPVAGKIPEELFWLSEKERPQPDVHLSSPGTLSMSGAPRLCISRTLSECGKDPGTLFLIPRAYVLGIGCRAGKTARELEEFILGHLRGPAIPINAVRMVCSIDVKAREPGLLEFCKKYELPFVTYSGEALAEVGGDFSSSAFVRDHVGVDNVCERSAVKGSGDGKLIMRKQAENGMTIALAYQERSVQF